MMTRAQYLRFSSFDYTPAERFDAHRRYHAQFVDARTISYVVAAIGADRLKAATQPYMSEIPMIEWDRLSSHLPLAARLQAAGDYPTLAGLVCIAKEAAFQYVESTKAEA